MNATMFAEYCETGTLNIANDTVFTQAICCFELYTFPITRIRLLELHSRMKL
jgi:hypothetical protein